MADGRIHRRQSGLDPAAYPVESGGLQGSSAYLAIVPTGGGLFFVTKEFGSGGFTAAVAATNGLIGQLGPR